MEWNAKWLKTARDFGEVAPLFEKDFSLSGDLRNATLYLTALGAYEASSGTGTVDPSSRDGNDTNPCPPECLSDFPFPAGW